MSRRPYDRGVAVQSDHCVGAQREEVEVTRKVEQERTVVWVEPARREKVSAEQLDVERVLKHGNIIPINEVRARFG